MGAVMATSGRSVQASEDNWMFPPAEGWTFDQVKHLDLPFEWELVDGVVVVRGQTKLWHNVVRDKIARHLEVARTGPFEVVTEQCVLYDDHNTPKPDVIVYDPTGLDFFDLECVPVDKLALAVEVVSPGSRQDDRVRKPALFASALVPYYWRVEIGRDRSLAVHEFWLHHRHREYIEAPETPVHRKVLVTEHPYPLEIDLRTLLGFGRPHTGTMGT
ncbi:Uma2 family endonuclease [Streptomyces sp. NPDC086023]|uniref:Uma2 family endonuclease n=1 Tax=Streptomyces sp. NPDC086023 TaxID=3365746 RepID=UPI0037CF801F